MPGCLITGITLSSLTFENIAAKAVNYLVLTQRVYTGWRPVVAVFCNILFSCNRHIVLSDSMFWFNKLGVNVVVLLSYFHK